MAWVQIRLNSTDKQAEQISDFLTEIGAVSVTFMDSKDTPIFEPLPGENTLVGEYRCGWFIRCGNRYGRDCRGVDYQPFGRTRFCT